jgi:hypothetical protein
MPSRSVIEDFRAAVRASDASLLAPLLRQDVRIFGAVSHQPFEGKDAVTVVLGALSQVCQDIEYVSELLSHDGAAFLIRGRIKELDFDGASFLTFDDDGLITEFRDFVRPLSATLALQEGVGEYIASLSQPSG